VQCRSLNCFILDRIGTNLPLMRALPRLTDAEWQVLSPLVKANKHGRAIDDRRAVLAFFLAEVRDISLENVAAELGLSGATLRTRRKRWLADGTMARLFERGPGVIERLRREQFGHSDVIAQQSERMERLFQIMGWE
jgi:hypothetical protein